MSYPKPLPTRDGKEVVFSAPRAVKGLPDRRGVIVSSVNSGPHQDDEWGYYIYFAERIRWDDGSYSIRLAYYYAPSGSKHWLWGGQYSIEDSPAIIKDLLEKTLRNTDWFADTEQGSAFGTKAQKKRAEVLGRTHGALDEADGLAFEQAMKDARRLEAHG